MNPRAPRSPVQSVAVRTSMLLLCGALLSTLACGGGEENEGDAGSGGGAGGGSAAAGGSGGGAVSVGGGSGGESGGGSGGGSGGASAGGAGGGSGGGSGGAGGGSAGGSGGGSGGASAGGSGGGSGGGSASSSLNAGYMKATWGSNVTITYGDCTLTYQSNGLPNHARDAEYALPNAGVTVPTASTAHAGDDPTTAQNYNITLNTCPTLQSSATSTNLGSIGYMISGAALFNAYEGNASTVALASNFYVLDSSGNKVYFIDSCNGHPGPGGQYHYHGLPACVTAEVDSTGGPSHIIGIALDGFPVYGNVDLNGNTLGESDLDECNGITSATPEFPDGVYHYVLLNTQDDASSLRCYKGTPASSASTGMGSPPGGRRSDRSGCDSALALAPLDPSPGARLWSGIAQSLRSPLGFF